MFRRFFASQESGQESRRSLTRLARRQDELELDITRVRDEMALLSDAWGSWQSAQSEELERVRKAYRRGARTAQAAESAGNGDLVQTVPLTLDEKMKRHLARSGGR